MSRRRVGRLVDLRSVGTTFQKCPRKYVHSKLWNLLVMEDHLHRVGVESESAKGLADGDKIVTQNNYSSIFDNNASTDDNFSVLALDPRFSLCQPYPSTKEYRGWPDNHTTCVPGGQHAGSG